MSGIGDGSMGGSWQKRERAAEQAYFSKQDADALAALAKKMHAHSTPTPEKVTKEKHALATLFDKHGVKAPDALLEEVRRHLRRGWHGLRRA